MQEMHRLVLLSLNIGITKFNWADLQTATSFPVGVAGLSGAQTIVARGKVKLDVGDRFFPYIPLQSLSLPGNIAATLRQNGVFELQVTNGGLGLQNHGSF